MKTLFSSVIGMLLLGCLTPANQYAGGRERPADAKGGDGMWENNKLVPEQPFPARVRAVRAQWVGYDLLLEEIGGTNRLCEAKIWFTLPLEFTILDRKKEWTPGAIVNRFCSHWRYLATPVELNEFSIESGPSKLGRRFGEDDVLRDAKERKNLIHKQKDGNGESNNPN